MYSTCSRPGASLLVKQRAASKINPVRPLHHGILFCFVLCTKYLPCRSLHDSSSHREYSCTVVVAHKPAWICIPQEGMFFIVFCTAVLLLIGTSCCPWGNAWATAHCCEWCQHIFECVVISTLSKQVSKKSFLHYTVICLVDILSPLPPLQLDGVAEFFLQFKQANYVNYCLLTPIKAYSCLEEETVHSLLLSQYQQVDKELNGSPVFHCSWRVGLGGEAGEKHLLLLLALV